MTLITRRRFVQQTALTAAALYQRRLNTLSGAPPIFGAHEQKAASIDPVAIRKLASEITGHVITPEASDYELSRLVENRAFDRHPALIVRVANPSDVARVLDFGQKLKLPLAVRSGGHSAAGFGVCDGGVLKWTPASAWRVPRQVAWAAVSTRQPSASALPPLWVPARRLELPA